MSDEQDRYGIMQGIQRKLADEQRAWLDHYTHRAFGIPKSDACGVCNRPPAPPPTLRERITSRIDRLRVRLARWIGGDALVEDDYDEDW